MRKPCGTGTQDDYSARVVEFFEKNDEDGALMQYHNVVEGVAHRAGFWIFTVVFPAMFAVFWLSLILLAYGIIG
jgi:hypothetical protein